MQNIVHSIYFSDNCSETATHHHDCHQIIFILKGKVEICINDKKSTAKSGDIIIFSRYENHSVKILSNEYERFVLRINFRIHNHHDKIFTLLSNRPVGFDNKIDVSENLAEFKRLFEYINTEFDSPKVLSDDLLISLINQLLIMIYRSSSGDESYFVEESLDTILKLQKELEDNYGSNFSLNELAKKYSLSVSSLSHQFKKITGMSVMGYLLSCRIAGAKSYLLNTKLSVNEIVELCGFSDNSNFSRTFKRIVGITPTEFRNGDNH